MSAVYFVPTPIGNLGDITFRAVEVLNSVDVIYCEDTRHSRVLLKHYNISKPLKSLHKYNEKEALDALVAAVKDGGSVAIVSDAGMPGVCDPGFVLVERLIEEGIGYTVLPGACAFVNAFVMAGAKLPMTFLGFLKEKDIDKKRQLEEVEKSNTLILYASVHNVNDDLKFLYGELGDRKVAIVREISKMFESVVFANLADATAEITKGEFVLVVEGVKKESALNAMTVLQHVEHYQKTGLDKSEAIKRAAKDRGIPKNEVYKLFVK